MGETFDWLTSSEQWSGPAGIPARLVEHIWYSALGVVIAALIAFPAGLLIGHTGRGSLAANSASNFWRALPTLGLVVLAIPPILLNTEVGIRGIDPGIRDAARGMGMTGWQALWRVEVPLAMPLILAGFRSATGQVIATATIAAFVGLGGLGRFIIDGYSVRDIGEISGGALVVAVLALVAEGGYALLQRSLGPKEGSRRRRVAGPAVHH